MWDFVLLLLSSSHVLFCDALPDCTNIFTSSNINVCKRVFSLAAGVSPYSLSTESPPGANAFGLGRKFLGFMGLSGNFVIWQDSNKQIWSTWVGLETSSPDSSNNNINNILVSAATTHNLVAVANSGDSIVYLLAAVNDAGDKVSPLDVQLVKCNALSGVEISRRSLDCSQGGLNVYSFSPTDNSGDMVWNADDGTVGAVFSRTLLQSEDGLNHESGLAVVFDANSLDVKNDLGQTSGHSFANNLILSGGKFVGMDLGDNFPRGIDAISFTSSDLDTNVVYTYKTLHGTAPNYCKQYNIACNLPVYPPWPEISTEGKTFYKWSNDNDCYTELAHKGMIELTDSFMLLFAGENSPPLDNSKTGAAINTARNLGMVRMAKAGYPHSAVLSTGQDGTGGYYGFNGVFQSQSNKGIMWLTASSSLSDNVSRPKTARLGLNQNLITWESWTTSNFVASKMMMIDDVGGIVWGPITVDNPLQLPQGDDLFVAGSKAYGYVGQNGNLIQYEISLPSQTSVCVGLDCGAHGSCLEPNPGCVCQDGWTGDRCDISPPQNDSHIGVPFPISFPRPAPINGGVFDNGSDENVNLPLLAPVSDSDSVEFVDVSSFLQNFRVSSPTITPATSNVGASGRAFDRVFGPPANGASSGEDNGEFSFASASPSLPLLPPAASPRGSSAQSGESSYENGV